MPCSDYRPGEHSVLIQRRLDAATRLLCGLCAYIEKRIGDDVISRIYGLTDWWGEHKKKDEERREKEQDEQRQLELRREVYTRLTPEERRALGLQ